MSETIPVFLDCDTGIDDALALAHLLSRDDVDLVGIGAASGNVTAAQAAANTLALLELAGRTDIPVAVGGEDHRAHPFDGGAPHVHGANGIGGLDLAAPAVTTVEGSAADLLITAAKAHPGRLRVVAIAPLTNLALALDQEPELPGLIESLTIMGGAVWGAGNRTPFAEANIAGDPEAAALVFAADWPITLVPLDVTRQHRFDESDRAALLAAGTPMTSALGEMLTTYFDFYETVLGERMCLLHDPLASMIATGDVVPDLTRATAIRVDQSDGPERGRTAPVDGEGTLVVTSAPSESARLLLAQLLGEA
ncbi:nucleoside hydrolase [Frondihabitans sp. PhB188]|uniref:nucleoside hydrolase n=1 Tax=Frondihabitans sp. PhB188 TaxID=2485200 RepID=UPI0018F27A3A|nr:nucleoside hydrolase [Frondihabitans sp. PhB188]